MDASAALSELVELSTQVVEVVIAGAGNEVEAARTSDDDRARELASVGEALLAEAAAVAVPIWQATIPANVIVVAVT